MIKQPYHIYLERRDNKRNMARFYAISIEPSLFNEITVERRWGRIGAKGNAKIHFCGHEGEAVEIFLSLLRKKRRRGYRPKPA